MGWGINGAPPSGHSTALTSMVAMMDNSKIVQYIVIDIIVKRRNCFTDSCHRKKYFLYMFVNPSNISNKYLTIMLCTQRDLQLHGCDMASVNLMRTSYSVIFLGLAVYQ